MLKQTKAFIRKTLVSLMGEKVFIYYSLFWALLAGWFYGNPSKKMLVVVVTGTKGKTSTLNFLWHVLTAGGYKVGLISTANIRIGSVEKMNWYHMTMPGRFLLQKLLRQMSDARCDIALVEATSEGIKMGRHIGLYYDVAVFTNLHPEHLKSHGNSFEEYRRMKGKLFQNLSTLPLKRWNGLDLEKVSIVNADSKDSEYFLQFDADKKYSYGENNGEYRFANVLQNQGGVSFSVLGSGEDVEDVFEESFYEIPILGTFNIYNAMPAILLGRYLKIPEMKIIEGVKDCAVIPGRMELIDEGQNYIALVDYAHEGVSMRLALESARLAKKTPENKLIAVYGGEGGGRDLSKRETMSKAVTDLATHAIVTLSDPFDADPDEINKDIVKWLVKFGFKDKGENRNIWDYVDRREAIKKAISLAEEGDVILFASKGAEQSIVFADRVEKWDDRVEVRLAIQNRFGK